ncbi:anthranilate N-methyltransferase-like [Fagus crenata]
MGKNRRQKAQQRQEQMASSSSFAGQTNVHPTAIGNQEEQKEEEEQVFSQAMELVYGSLITMAMHTAIELGVFEILGKVESGATLSSEQIVAQMPTTNPDAPALVERICSFLALHGVLGCSLVDDVDTSPSQKLYYLKPVSKHFARCCNQDGVSLAPLVALVHDKVYLESWSQLKNAILEGGHAFNRAHDGMNAYEYASKDARFSQVFNTAMFNRTTILVKKMLESYKGFEKLKQVVDVGGGIGVALSLITSKYPNIKGINFDLPHVIQHAPPFPGVKHVAGDMFESVPKGDAIFLKGILHAWSDDCCLKLLKNCYNALPNTGKVIVLEQILPIYVDIAPFFQEKSLSDMLMMTQTPGGKERMQQELFALAFGAGFKRISIAGRVCNTIVLEFIKN